MKKLYTMILAVAACLSAYAAQADYTMAPNGGDLYMWGTGATETYDVAIHITDPSLVGKQITGISVPISSSYTSFVSNTKIWLSTELKLENGKNSPDIVTKSATVKNGKIYATFDSPYTIPEGGVYAGYSLMAVFKNAKQPIDIYTVEVEGGLYLHTTTTAAYKDWTDATSKLGATSAMVVNMQGDFAQYSVGIESIEDVYVKSNTATSTTMTLTNYGASEVSSITYEFTAGGQTQTVTSDLSTPLPNLLGASRQTAVQLPGLPDGKHDITVKITKVNGQPNQASAEEATGTGVYYSFDNAPVNRPVFEEYTGTWCGWCPRGFVGLELMNESYPDFIGISYHNGDSMEMMPLPGNSTGYPNMVQGFPAGWMNRSFECDAYFGLSNSTFGLPDVWESEADKFCPIVLNLNAEWADETKTEVNVNAEVEFLVPMKGEYKIEYVLLADGPVGNQSNYYSGNTAYMSLPGMATWVQAGSTVRNVVFNDVAVLTSGLKGVAGSLPAEVEEGVKYHHTYTFAIADAVNKSGAAIITPDCTVRVAAFVLKSGGTYGTIMNGNKCEIGMSGVGSTLNSASPVVSTALYDLSGRLVAAPQPGSIYIRSDRRADGSTVNSKIVF